MTLRELLERKNSGIITIRASVSVLEAIETMCRHRVGSLLVEADDGGFLGIVTERDILHLCARLNGNLGGAVVQESMTRDLMVATPEMSADEAMSLMTEHRFRHLPVVEGGRPVGIVSIGDLVKAQLKDVKVEVKYLREYISA
jgi:CBS domain-containing protein